MVEAEAMGFDFAACVEHHFTDYAACPDPVQALSYVAAKTKTIKLMPAAIILPWNDPLRVVEKMAMLDSLSEGRAVLGMGRGAARREFKSFGRDLADSREIFDDAALILLAGLETGGAQAERSEEHTSELQSLMRNSYAVFCLTTTKNKTEPPN